MRGGYGIFYAHPFDSGQPNTAALGFSTSTALSSPDNGITAPFFLKDGVPAVQATIAPRALRGSAIQGTVLTKRSTASR